MKILSSFKFFVIISIFFNSILNKISGVYSI